MLKDIYGKLIEAGDYVVYGIDFSNQGGLRIGLVVEPQFNGGEKVKLITASKWDYFKLTPRAVYAKPDHMLRINSQELHPKIIELLEAEYKRRGYA